ncbi:MAG: LPS export ABC transporter permease LptF, partial [Salinisphaera sp.]|nr:LPS export ABC transporter permease LptF [Salinisphaera sp.]
TGLRAIVSLELLLPLGLYLGLIFGLGRLYRDSEMAVLQASGLSRRQMLWPLLRLIVLTAILVGLLSVFVRPWAYGQIYRLEASAQAQLDLAFVEAGRFQGTPRGSLVVYSQQALTEVPALHETFATWVNDGERVIVVAERVTQQPRPGHPPSLVFHNGRAYRLDPQGSGDLMLRFQTLRWDREPSREVIGYKRKAASTLALMDSADNDDASERQWRLSRPLATIFLGLLGIAFARSSPRRGRAGNAFAAVVLFLLYYNLAELARTWVDNGSLPVIPGIYWVDALMGLLACWLLFRPGMRHY